MEIPKAPNVVHSTLPAMEEIRRYETSPMRFVDKVIDVALLAVGFAALIAAGISHHQ